ncbi:myosin light chain kinase 2 skeletal/cardiac muscle-like [Scophthalmus maximus]|uniref:Myosin light chain kinase 2 skeletal/cardiac muscle-like n=1 Tax=Scophthalmus maximus TaxID=52904 RepID=A0A2U9BJU9_SCOMX|nr:myosin light chain kinase 2, skeletal/cardiac muscle isoform X1 [Scophthalmus maximus]XP_035490681.1 myosin light chain kinase 2, skeletal/cardiac muscle isoform X1 [Scophthalmus maximus]AWP03996.1 myosin light chain kinase 2 skeletal/cardiac muscle-like [Scophthalmus maximus]
MSALVMKTVGDDNGAGFDLIQNRIESLSSKMDKLINIQEKVLNRLDGMSQDIDGIEKDMENLKVDKEEIHLPMSQTQVVGREVKEICHEMSTIMSVVNQRSEQQAQKLEGMEKLVLSMQQVIGFIGETVKSSRIIELILKGPTARKGSKPKDSKGKQAIKGKTSTDTITKKLDKRTTSNKTGKGNQQITPACEPSTPQLSHKKKLHGPKHFLASRKCGKCIKDQKGKDGTEKPCLSPKSQKAQKRIKPPDTEDNISMKKQVLLLQEVQKLNRANTEKSDHQLTTGYLDLEAGVSPKDQQLNASGCNLVDYLREDSEAAESHEVVEALSEEEVGAEVPEGEAGVTGQEPKLDVKDAVKGDEEETLKVTEEKEEEEASAADEVAEAPELPAVHDNEKEPTAAASPDDHSPSEQDQKVEISSTTTKTFVTEEHFLLAEPTKSQALVVEEEKEKREDNDEDEHKLESEGWAVFRADGVEIQLNLKQRVERERKANDAAKEEDDDAERYLIDTIPPPGAPFNHRIVSAKPNQISNFYTINWQEVLGGGRFGQVHKCIENSSGLTLAAKVIKARGQKEKEVVKNEIQVMNNLDHANLIQLYAAYESRNDIILVLEYVGGGELFDRIIDENYTLMELDALVFIRQICEGLQHMHKMYILHLDLKPENILCVSRVTNKIKIIDFGLARIYKPREKLRVNFGTPEFLAPEVINYDFVSFNTDMWSLGVITYMLLSGLCPFLGDDDNQTLNNILACQWNFEEQEFIDTSEEAKDFISRLLIVNKSWRMGASESLRHPWLSDSALHHRLHTKKTMCRSRRSSCVPTTDS